MLVTALCNGRWRYRSRILCISAPLAAGVSCAGALKAPAMILHRYKMCVYVLTSAVQHLWIAVCFLYVHKYVMFLYWVHPWDLNVIFSLAPESGLSWKHILGCIINLSECRLLGGKLWKCWISLPCVLSPTRVFSRETGGSCRLHHQVRPGCLSHHRALLAAMLSGVGRSRRSGALAHAGAVQRAPLSRNMQEDLSPFLQELLRREGKTNGPLMV